MIVLDLQEPLRQGVCLMVGNYDGIHLGHQEIIRLARRRAQEHNLKTAVLSFEPHPMKVLDPSRAPQLIHSPFLKAALLDFFGVDYYLIQKFTRGLAESEATAFVSRLKQSVDFKVLLVGSDFRFGCNRRGDTHLLRKLGPQLGFDLVELEEVTDPQGKISSTRIRQLVSQGRIEEAETLLGHPYFLEGRVARGHQIGRKLGTPTANMEVNNDLIPGKGVYASWLWVEDRWLPSLTNIGTRPTFSQGGIQVETHALGFAGEIYGRHVVICLTRFIRDEIKFENAQSLRAQIARDIDVRQGLGDQKPPTIAWFAGRENRASQEPSACP